MGLVTVPVLSGCMSCTPSACHVWLASPGSPGRCQANLNSDTQHFGAMLMAHQRGRCGARLAVRRRARHAGALQCALAGGTQLRVAGLQVDAVGVSFARGREPEGARRQRGSRDLDLHILRLRHRALDRADARRALRFHACSHRAQGAATSETLSC